MPPSPTGPDGPLLKLGLFMARGLWMYLVIPTEHAFGVLRAHGLPAEHCDRIRAELALWWLPNFLIYPVAVVLSLAYTVGMPQKTDVDTAEALRQLAGALLGMAVIFGIALFVVAILHNLGRGMVRRLLRDVARCAEEVAVLHLEINDSSPACEWVWVARGRSTARAVVKDKARSVTGYLAHLAGHPDRDRHPVHDFGRWMHWTAEDVVDPRRVEGGLYACVDMLRHLLGPSPLRMPRLQKPPPEAGIDQPTRWWTRRVSVARTALVATLPLATAIISFLAKLP